jgi:hypothetical protein
MNRPTGRLTLLSAAACLVLVATLAPSAGAQSQDAGVPAGEAVEIHPAHPDIVPLTVPDRATIDRLSDLGFDLAEEVVETAGGIEVQAIATKDQQAALRDLGIQVGAAVKTEADAQAIQREYRAMTRSLASAQAVADQAGDELRVQRAQWFDDSQQGRFLEVEVWSATGATSAAVTVTVAFNAGGDTPIGAPGSQSFNLSRFVDAGQYMFHRASSPVRITSELPPTRMRVTSTMGGEVIGSREVAVTETLTGVDGHGPGSPREQSGDYESSFVDKYVDATESTAKIEALAAEFPHLAEVIELPYKTNGYRRHAMRTAGTLTNHAVVLTTRAWGHEGGNDVTFEVVDPGTANSALGVSVSGRDITVSAATNGAGALTSTAAQIVAAINADPAASALVTANTYRGNAGAGVAPVSARGNLSDFLTAPDSVSRDPFTVKVLRIGKARDGSKVGVFGYAQEHAREWVTPLVALESAERLLRNYDNDVNTKRMVDDLDIFIAPTINPDGAHYSIHDYTLQRRNMVNYCPPTGNNDAAARNTWGVDLNRNFTVGSRLDGYSGASASCTSDTFSGPSELSEPEAKNEVWLTEQFPNIKFSMNIHSHGGYFMWAPGAYKSAGREGLPRPSYGTERYFYEASAHILNRIKEHRGTNIWDARVGPISDVLYSAAGNSGDEHYYNKGIFAWSFEVGAPRRNAADTGWTSVGFTPPFAEGYEEAQEFSNGLIGMFEVARMYARDTIKPQSAVSPGPGTYTGPTEFTFSVDEPADVYYTVDGSRPTLDSAKLSYQGPRQGEASITLDRSTTVQWFSVDVRGNVEGGYKPDGNGQNFRRQVVAVQ